MRNNETRKNDNINKIYLTVSIITSISIVFFTFVFGFFEYKNQKIMQDLTVSNNKVAEAQLQLTASNNEIAKAQFESSLIPLFTSGDNRKIEMAMFLAKTIDKEFALKMAIEISKKNSSKKVRDTAITLVDSLVADKEENIKMIAKEGVKQYDVANELRSKNLLKKIYEAQGYLEGGNADGYEKSVKLYKEVIKSLSPTAVKNIDQKLLNIAKEHEEKDAFVLAARTYRALFSNYQSFIKE